LEKEGIGHDVLSPQGASSVENGDRDWAPEREGGIVMPLTDHEVSIAKGRISRGDRQHDIAAYFGVNGGRIGEISTVSGVKMSRRRPRLGYRPLVPTWRADPRFERATPWLPSAN
jgi:hypothetical protein